jgi:hypothetical protein
MTADKKRKTTVIMKDIFTSDLDPPTHLRLTRHTSRSGLARKLVIDGFSLAQGPTAVLRKRDFRCRAVDPDNWGELKPYLVACFNSQSGRAIQA